MPLFRNKPIVRSAEQFFRMKPPYPEGVEYEMRECDDGIERPCVFRIKTLEGVHNVTDGDWIVTGVNGERYPVKPDIFEKTYEPVIASEVEHTLTVTPRDVVTVMPRALATALALIVDGIDEAVASIARSGTSLPVPLDHITAFVRQMIPHDQGAHDRFGDQFVTMPRKMAVALALITDACLSKVYSLSEADLAKHLVDRCSLGVADVLGYANQLLAENDTPP